MYACLVCWKYGVEFKIWYTGSALYMMIIYFRAKLCVTHRKLFVHLTGALKNFTIMHHDSFASMIFDFWLTILFDPTLPLSYFNPSKLSNLFSRWNIQTTFISSDSSFCHPNKAWISYCLTLTQPRLHFMCLQSLAFPTRKCATE